MAKVLVLLVWATLAVFNLVVAFQTKHPAYYWGSGLLTGATAVGVVLTKF